MAEMPENIRLRVVLDEISDLTSSRVLSMAEAALDEISPHWRGHVPQMRQSMKDRVAMAIFMAAVENPVGVRCGVAMSEAGRDEQSRPPHCWDPRSHD